LQLDWYNIIFNNRGSSNSIKQLYFYFIFGCRWAIWIIE
jgi:hypothetical protein